MGNFKHTYRDYPKDLKALFNGFDLERLGAFKQYFKDKADNEPAGSPKKTAANTLWGDLSEIISPLQGIVSRDGSLTLLDKLDSYLKNDGQEQNFDFEKKIKKYEIDLFLAVEYAEKLSEDLNNYNLADGYEELQSNALMQEMFQKFEAMSCLAIRRQAIEAKQVESDISKSFHDIEIKRGRILDSLEKQMSEPPVLSWTEAERNKEQCLIRLEKSQEELEELNKTETKKLYEDNWKKTTVDYRELVEKRNALSQVDDEVKRLVERNEEALPRLSELKLEEEDYLENLKLRQEALLESDKEYQIAKENLEAVQKELEKEKEEGKEKKKNEVEEALKEVINKNPRKEKLIREYFDTTVAYRQWQRMLKATNDFLKKYQGVKGEDWVMMAVFDQAKWEKNKQFQMVKSVLTAIQHAQNDWERVMDLCPDEKFFEKLTGRKAVLEKLEETVNAAKAAYDQNLSAQLENEIRGMDSRLLKLKKQKLSAFESEAESVSLKRLFKSREDLRENKASSLSVSQYAAHDDKTKLNPRLNLTKKQELDVKEQLLREIKLGETRILKQEMIVKRNEDWYVDTRSIDKIVERQLQTEVSDLKDKEIEARRKEKEAKLDKDNKEGGVDYYRKQIRYTRLYAYRRVKGVAESSIVYVVMGVPEDEKKIDDIDEKTHYVEKLFEKTKKDQENYLKKLEADRKAISKYDMEIKTMMEKEHRYSPDQYKKDILDAEETIANRKRDLEGAEAVTNKMSKIYFDYSEFRNSHKAVYDEFHEKQDNKLVFSGIRQSVSNYAGMYENAMRPKHDNSGEYKAIWKKLDAVSKINDKRSITDMKNALDELGLAAAEYLTAKGREWRLFPSKQRIFRLNYARSIQNFCVTQLAMLNETGIEISDRNKGFMKTVEKMAKSEPMSKEDFFDKKKNRHRSAELAGVPEKQERTKRNPQQLAAQPGKRKENLAVEGPRMETEKKKQVRMNIQ